MKLGCETEGFVGHLLVTEASCESSMYKAQEKRLGVKMTSRDSLGWVEEAPS